MQFEYQHEDLVMIEWGSSLISCSYNNLCNIHFTSTTSFVCDLRLLRYFIPHKIDEWQGAVIAIYYLRA